MNDMKINFGMHKGKTLEQITNSGLDHDGLLYLDWCLSQDWLKTRNPILFKAIKQYLAEPDVARSLELALEER